MAGYVEVLKVDGLKDGQMKAVKAGGQEILVAKVGGKFYAAENKCPRMGGNLAQGKLEGTVSLALCMLLSSSSRMAA